MNTITIQGLAKPCSKLIMGSDFFSPDHTDTVSELLHAYVSLGGNAIDTARIYGHSERTIGLWLQQVKREDIIILTKGAHHDHNGPRVTPEDIDYDLNVSLEELRTDYVDLYALHRDNPDVPVGVIMEALNKHIEVGRIRAIGGSNWSHERLQEANEYAAKHGLIGFTFSSTNLSLAKPKEPFWEGCISADEATCAWHQQHQLPLLSWSSQARGFFTGRFRPEVTDNADMVRVYYNDENWERLHRAGKLAKEKNCSLIQIALAYVLNQPFPTAALVGPRNRAEIQSCFEAMQIKLSEQEMNWLDLQEEKA
ncbi:aldo/keto reductase [Laceyella putida]|uniref:Aldo/keto reductase n=1 Tax=Laceyella putida TaxID=110101 RepID=A0ABW2RQJ9_9BACL